MPKSLPKRSKEMIASLIEYFTKERDHGGPLLSLKSIQQVREKFNVMFIIKAVLILLQTVADALKMNLCTVSSVNNQVKAGEPLTSPPQKKRPRKKQVCDISQSEKCEIRGSTYETVEKSIIPQHECFESFKFVFQVNT
jgi:hypothetical protein